MKNKHAPEQYAAKPKATAVKPRTTLSVHPAVGVARELARWLERGGVPPSVILLHGLHLARCSGNDGFPVDTPRPHLKMQGTDSKTISEILDAMARPQAVKTRIIAEWLQSIWVKQSVGTSLVSSSQNDRETPTAPNRASFPQWKAQGFFSTKPVIVIKKKRVIKAGTV